MRRASPSPAVPPRQAGVALVLTAVLGFLLAALFAMSLRATHDAIRGERFQIRRELHADTLTASLADAITLLETGLPPADPYECIVTKTDDNGAEWSTKITYAATAPLAYDVSAELATADEVDALPGLPVSF